MRARFLGNSDLRLFGQCCLFKSSSARWCQSRILLSQSWRNSPYACTKSWNKFHKSFDIPLDSDKPFRCATLCKFVALSRVRRSSSVHPNKEREASIRSALLFISDRKGSIIPNIELSNSLRECPAKYAT